MVDQTTEAALGADDRRGRWFSLLRSPSVVAVIITAGGALVGVVLTTLVSFHQLQLENQEHINQLELERLKHDSAAILKTIELGNGDPARIRANLLFLVENEIIRDPLDIMRDHLRRKQNMSPTCTVGVC